MRYKLPAFASVLGLLLVATTAGLVWSGRGDTMTPVNQAGAAGWAPACAAASAANPSGAVACGDTITSDTTLTADLTDCPGNGLIIGADNITLDCDGHTIDGSGGGSGISVSGRSWDTIKNCVVTDFGNGIFLSEYSSNNTLTDNTANSNFYGFWLSDSSSNTLTGSTANGNWYYGIYLWNSSNNTLSGSTMRDNSGTALSVMGINNTISGSTIRNNGGTGVGMISPDNTVNSNVVCSNKLDISSSGSNSGDDNTCMSTNNWNDSGSEGCTTSCPQEPVCYCSSCSECNEKLAGDCPVVKLTADIADQSGSCISQAVTFNGEVFDCQGHTIDGDDSGSGTGISLYGRSWDTIKNCVVTDFGYGGISLGSYSSNITLTDNTANSNFYGFWLSDSSSNTLTDSTANGNSYDGIYLWNSSNNTLSGSTMRDNSGQGLSLMGINNSIYNNYFSNAHNVTASGTNTWNIAKTAGTNIFGGPYLGGNFWSDYVGVDTNGDGLGDTGLPYNANGNIQNGGDYLPLVPVSGSPVGGIAEYPQLEPGAATSAHGSSGPNALTLAGVATGGALLLAAGGWYSRRRWSARR